MPPRALRHGPHGPAFLSVRWKRSSHSGWRPGARTSLRGGCSWNRLGALRAKAYASIAAIEPCTSSCAAARHTEPALGECCAGWGRYARCHYTAPTDQGFIGMATDAWSDSVKGSAECAGRMGRAAEATKGHRMEDGWRSFFSCWHGRLDGMVGGRAVAAEDNGGKAQGGLHTRVWAAGLCTGYLGRLGRLDREAA